MASCFLGIRGLSRQSPNTGVSPEGQLCRYEAAVIETDNLTFDACVPIIKQRNEPRHGDAAVDQVGK